MAWVIRRQIKIDDFNKQDTYFKGSDFAQAGPASFSWSPNLDKAMMFDSQQEGVAFAVDSGLIHTYGQRLQVVQRID